MAKAPLTRIGGKYYLRGFLMNKIQAHNIYCEPFAGAGHLLFAKPESKIEIINDIDNHLINFFKVIKDPRQRVKLVMMLDAMPYSRNEFIVMRHKWRNSNYPVDRIQRAAEWFFLNRACFAGDMERGGFATPSRIGNRNPCVSFRNMVDKLKQVGKRLKYVTFENLDYSNCILKYDTPETFFYCDPPYFGSKDYYSTKFTESNHRQLAEILHGIKGKAMISHYSNPVYDELYKGWNRDQFQSFNGSITKANNKILKNKTTEVVYMNF